MDTEKETPVGAQGKVDTHAVDTSTHGVAEVADKATVSTEIDNDIATHTAIAVNVHGVGVGNDVASDADIAAHEADTSTHGVAEVADVATVSAEIDNGIAAHEADTSTHGVAEVADVATVSAEIDNGIAAHAAIAINVHGVGAGNDVASDADIAAHGADTSTHGVAEVAGTSDAQTLTNKTIDGDQNTLSNIDIAKLAEVDKQSFTNLVANGDFESWSAGAAAAPDGWEIMSSAVPTREDTTVKIGTYSLKIDNISHGLRHLKQIIPNPTRYQSRIVTLCCWVWSASANTARIRIGDSSGSNEIYHSGTSSWEFLTITRAVGAAASSLYISLYPDATDITHEPAYFDGAILVEGSVCPAFSPKPLAEVEKNMANGVAGLDANVQLDILQMRPCLEDYFNHLGNVDNFMETATLGNGSAAEDAANHEMDVSSGANLQGYGAYRTKKTWTLGSKPIVSNFLIQNYVSGVGGDRIMRLGLANVFSNVTPSDAAVFQHYNGVWKASNASASTWTHTAIGSLASGDLVTIVATISRVLFYVNGVVVADHNTNVPSAALLAGVCADEADAATSTATSVSIDMISVRRYV